MMGKEERPCIEEQPACSEAILEEGCESTVRANLMVKWLDVLFPQPSPEETNELFEEFTGRLASLVLRGKLRTLTHGFSFIANRREQKRRLALIQELYVAKQKLMDGGDLFSLAHVDGIVEGIIDGNWEDVKHSAEMFNYEREGPSFVEKYQERHAIFRDVGKRAIEGALPSDPPEDPVFKVEKGGAWGKR